MHIYTKLTSLFYVMFPHRCALLFHVCQLHSESFPKGSKALLSNSHENGNTATSHDEEIWFNWFWMYQKNESGSFLLLTKFLFTIKTFRSCICRANIHNPNCPLHFNSCHKYDGKMIVNVTRMNTQRYFNELFQNQL